MTIFFDDEGQYFYELREDSKGVPFERILDFKEMELLKQQDQGEQLVCCA